MMRPNDIVRALYRDNLAAYIDRAFAELNPGDSFTPGWHIRAICHQLVRVWIGDVRRLIVVLPPRHLKSHCVSVAFTAWVLGRDPTLRIVCASHSADLAQGFSLQARRLIEAPWHRATFPDLALDPRRASAEEFRTTRNGVRIATSVGGSLTGKGGDIIIVDDPLKAEDAHSEARREAVHAWFSGTVSSRLDDPETGAMIVVAQRLHEDDLPGRLIATGDWEVLELPAIATRRQEMEIGSRVIWTREPGELLHPKRVGKAELDRIRRELGEAAFEAQYQQRPAPPGGNLVKTEWLGCYETPVSRACYEAIAQSWDTASVPGESNDWCVCTTWGFLGNHIDLLAVHRAQHLFPDLVRAAHALRDKWQPSLIVIEEATSGIGLLQELRRVGIREALGLIPRPDKVQRMTTQSAKIEDGQVRLPEAAPWLEQFLHEVAAFPNGKHDDQVDSMSQMLHALDFSRTRQLLRISRFSG